MFKTKLFATICAAASAVTVAVTALTLGIAGPAGLQTMHTLSANDQIANSIAGVFSSASDTTEEITELIDTIVSNKTSTKIGFTINSLDGLEALGDLYGINNLAGLGGNVEFQLDTESRAAAFIYELALGSVAGVGGTLYIDENEILAAAPFLFEGVLKAGLDNLEEDLQNSYLGQIISEEINFDEIEETLNLLITEYETMMPKFNFDSEKFMEGLVDTMSDAFDNAMLAMEADDLGKQKLNGGSYQAYYAKIPVRELSYILRDAVVYCLESKDFQNLVDQVIEYIADVAGEDVSTLGFSGSMLGEYSSMVTANWKSVVSMLEEIMGKNIEAKIYITDTVELAGFELEG